VVTASTQAADAVDAALPGCAEGHVLLDLGDGGAV
jgi:hypothetical protein